MALGVAGDPDALELRARRTHCREQVRGAVEVARGVRGVARGHEQLAHSRAVQAAERLVEMLPVADEPRRQMRHTG